jgi:opacity protein-like surface antigen
MKTSVITFLSFVTMASSAFAADLYPYDSGMPGDVYTASTLRGSIGLRYWYSQGSSDVKGAIARIENENVTGHTIEFMGRLEDTSSGFFTKGYVGLGKNTDGSQSTLGLESNGWNTTNLGYLTLDGGWEFRRFSNNSARINALVGYQYLSDIHSASYNTVDARVSNKFHAFRVGVSADGQFNDRFAWALEAAAVPWAYNQVEDNVRKIESEYTYGFEADATLNVAVTQNWDIGVGGRYWWLHSDYELDQSQTYQRYGLLIESKYKF